jgi:GT2 family glycosyltransferase
VKLAVVIPVINKHDLTEKCLRFLGDNSTGIVDILVIDNASKQHAKHALAKKFPGVKFHRNSENVGMIQSMLQGYERTDADVIAYLHNDTFIYEKGWDEKVLRIFRERPDIGLAGFGGAPMLARGAGRVGFVSNMMGPTRQPQETQYGAETHGRRFYPGEELAPAAVLDGFSLICRVSMLEKVTEKYGCPFDTDYWPHHYYDLDIGLKSLDVGYVNAVINMQCDHLGGQTAVGEAVYQEWARTKHPEGDAHFHRDNHRIFEQKWGARLGAEVIVMGEKWSVIWNR